MPKNSLNTETANLAVLPQNGVLNEAKKVSFKKMSFSDRKEQAKKLANLYEQHEKMKKHAESLLELIQSDDSVRSYFTLENSEGAEWKTSNSNFIKKTVAVMHAAILERILEIEIEIEQIQIA